ncbi:hypothetical protein J6590_052018 [Homalodisca vitripennis]|nr:hypothetical protein J6590_052018 [Homalodisca vitripennis]
MERVLKQQKRAIRCLAGLQFQESCREAFKQLKILTIVNILHSRSDPACCQLRTNQKQGLPPASHSKALKAYNWMSLTNNNGKVAIPPARVTQNTHSPIDAICVNVLHTSNSDRTSQLYKLNLSVKKKTSSSSVIQHFNNRRLNNLKHCQAEETWDTVF